MKPPVLNKEYVGLMDSLKSILPKPVQRIEVTTLLDNYVDLMLEDTGIVKRPP